MISRILYFSLASELYFGFYPDSCFSLRFTSSSGSNVYFIFINRFIVFLTTGTYFSHSLLFNTFESLVIDASGS